MIRREGRVDAQKPDAVRAASRAKRGEVTNWEGRFFVLAVIVILILGGIAGMNSLIALFPR
jgi:hypothetical protein